MSKYAPAATGTYNLNSSIGSTDTSFTLSSFTDPTTAVPITMTTLNTDIGYGTIGPRTTSFELISFTGITQNADGTATLTGVTRGLSRQYPFTTSSAYKLPHSGQSIFILSDAPQVFAKYVTLENAETITGTKTFPGGGDASAPVSGIVYSSPTNDLEYASKKYVDTVAGGIAIDNAIVVSGTAGANLTAGWVVYQKTSDGKWYKVLANDTTTFQGQELGIAQATVSSGAAVNILIRGIDTHQTGLGAGTAYYATDAGGLPSTTPGTNTVFVGYGTTTSTNLLVDIRAIDIPYHGEKLAIAGDNTDIAVGSGNKMVTQTGFQKAAEIYGATATGNDTYVVTLSPAPTSYDNGRHYFVKLDVGNTGAATINFNGLGAISIVTGLATPLVTGDMVANGIYELIYNSTGPVFQLVNPASAILVPPVYGNNTTTYDVSTTSGTQNIAHGLGVVPKKLKITAVIAGTGVGTGVASGTGGAFGFESVGTYNGTTMVCTSVNSNGGANAKNTEISTSYMIKFADSATTSAVATVTVDATNIILAWTKTSTPSGTITLIWEANS